MKKITCNLHDATHIACDNQLLAIDALHQAIQIWTKTTGPPQTKKHRTTLSHTRTCPRPLLRPQEYQVPASTPRLVSPNPPAILIPQLSIASQDEPTARHTRYRFPTMDLPPPRVKKTTDTVPIARRTRSQTTAMVSVIIPAQTDQQRYPAKFLQSLAMPVPNKTSGQSLQ